VTTLSLAATTYLVRDYDEAIRWFVDVLGFHLLEDTKLSETKRWVRVAAHTGEPSLLLAKADGATQQAHFGKVGGGRVAFFLHTDAFQNAYEQLSARGVAFREKPRHEAYGTVAVFADLYGNAWDLIEPSAPV
jgi:catechol 2,3-dioxygenase-like lactoylglutathione lyase family enzyme